MKALFAQEPKLMLPVGHWHQVNFANFSPDGKRVVTASSDRIAKIWDVRTGTLLANLEGHKDMVLYACFSPDGKKIVTASDDSTARIWDAYSGLLIRELKGSSSALNKAVFSADDNKVLATGLDSTATIWDTQSGNQIGKITGLSSNDNTSALFSSDGQKILTMLRNNIVRIWDAKSLKPILDLRGQYFACFSPDGDRVATAAVDSTINIWDAKSGLPIVKLKEYVRTVYNLLFFPDGKKIIAASVDSGKMPDDYDYSEINSKATIWDAQSGNKTLAFKKKGLIKMAESASFSSDSKRVVFVQMDNPIMGSAVTIYDAQTGSSSLDIKLTTPVGSAYFSPDGKRILTTSMVQNSNPQLWDAQNGMLLFDLKGHNIALYDAAFSPNGNKIVTACLDHTAKIWDAQNGSLLAILRGHTYALNSARFSSDGKLIATSSEDETAKIWDVETGKMLANIKGHGNMVENAQFSPDAKKVVTASADSTAKIWDSETGDLLFNLRGHRGLVWFACFSQDGKRVITASIDSTAKIWDAETGRLLTDLKGHNDLVMYGEFSSDGNKVLTQSDHYAAKVWDAQSGKVLFDLKNSDQDGFIAHFTIDGKQIVGQTPYNIFRRWDAQTGKRLTDSKEYPNRPKDESFSSVSNKYIRWSPDGLCYVYNSTTLKLLYTFFAVDSTDYLVTDPYGRYDGTETARKLLYFTCGTDVIGLDQVKDQLWVPNLVERINKGDSINAKKLSDLGICGLIPHVEREEKSGYHFLITPQRGGLGETVLSVNGIEVKRYKPAQLIQTAGGFELNVPEQELQPYFIAGQQNPVTVKAYTAKNDISSRMALAMQDETAKKAGNPNLYAVMIGVSDYKSPELQLKYAAKDAVDISKAVASSARKLLNTDGKEHVYMYNLTTGKEHYQLPEKIAIKNILADIGKKANANDILLIFFAGHGVSSGEQKQFYFLTADASQATATDAPAEVGISTKELSEWMKPSIIKAQKRILILDACNSGQAIKEIVKIGDKDQNYVAARNDDKSEEIKAIDKLNERSGLFILAASASNQNAYEMGRYSQGLLTYALLKAIKQEPDILEDNKYLNVSRWFNAAEKTVSDIVRQTGNRQEPQIVSAGNFNIGVVDQDVMAGIKLANEKPLFTASNLQNNDPDIAADDLHLNNLLDMQLNEIAARGDDNAITYIPGSASPDAYSLGGRYEVKGDDLTLKVNIRQNDTTKYKFELGGKKSELKAVAEQVVNQATDWIVKHK